MSTMNGQYMGSLRTQAKHEKSGNTLITDAPTDNNGKGEAFSPTDLVCVALSSCMLTTMGILAEREGINMVGMTSEIKKIMDANPRRIKEIQITLSHANLIATDIQKEKLRRAAHTCPVALSLADTLKQTIIISI
jgi:putative redox protein